MLLNMSQQPLKNRPSLSCRSGALTEQMTCIFCVRWNKAHKKKFQSGYEVFTVINWNVWGYKRIYYISKIVVCEDSVVCVYVFILCNVPDVPLSIAISDSCNFAWTFGWKKKKNSTIMYSHLYTKESTVLMLKYFSNHFWAMIKIL